MTRFFRVQLRTSDVDAARAFYAAVFGDTPFEVVRLHDQAVARGARPHWLGFLGVAHVDRAMAAFIERGATRLSPTWVDPEGLEAATAREPGGAVVALAKPPALAFVHPELGDRSVTPAARSATGVGVDVVWHLLHTADVERAKANYAAMFGWEFKTPLDLGSLGLFHPFSWTPGAAAAGSMSDIATRSGVHPHWLFHFGVAALDPAVEAVRAGGGIVVDEVTPPGGQRIAICDDPQGAAFAMREERTR
jgi:predicted enzyme related to lactoylglutathione lyase